MIKGFPFALFSRPFSPKSIQGLVAWFDASKIRNLADADTISTWVDSSGKGHDASGSGGTPPAYKVNIINGRPVVRLSGSNGFQTASGIEADFDLGAPSIFVVAQKTNVGGTTTIMSKNVLVADATRRKLSIKVSDTTMVYESGNDGASISASATPAASFNIFGVIARATSDHDLVVNGVVTNSASALSDTTFNNGRYEIGQAFSNGAERFTGDIAEIIIYNHPLSVKDRKRVERYLSKKYGIATA